MVLPQPWTESREFHRQVKSLLQVNQLLTLPLTHPQKLEPMSRLTRLSWTPSMTIAGTDGAAVIVAAPLALSHLHCFRFAIDARCAEKQSKCSEQHFDNFLCRFSSGRRRKERRGGKSQRPTSAPIWGLATMFDSFSSLLLFFSPVLSQIGHLVGSCCG